MEPILCEDCARDDGPATQDCHNCGQTACIHELDVQTRWTPARFVCHTRVGCYRRIYGEVGSSSELDGSE